MRKKSDLFLAFDLGASNGRAILGLLKNGRMHLKVIHLFPNQPQEIDGTLYWDFPDLWRQVITGLRICSQMGYSRLSGIGVDTWGVDFGLLDGDGQLLGNPVHYRDCRTERVEQKILRQIGTRQLYKLTGQCATRVSTLGQLVAMRSDGSAASLPKADSLLLMPDLFRYFLSGKMASDLTSAGSSQLLNLRTKRWSPSLFRKLGLPLRVMPQLIPPGTIVGPLRKTILAQTGIQSAPVVAVAGHDTASAVAAIPGVGANSIFVSSGTWSMIGIRRETPLISGDALRLGFTNVAGFRAVLFMKGIMGLYLIENLRRSWSRRDRKVTHAQLVQMASRAKPFQFYIDVNSPLLFSADSGAEECIISFLRQTGQRKLPDRNELLRSLLEGLAYATRQVANDLQKLTSQTYRRINLVGGGSQNALLCQFTANATGMETMAGPAQAATIGNLAIQAFAIGRFKYLADISEMVAYSFPQKCYHPRETGLWDQQFKRYQQTTGEVK